MNDTLTPERLEELKALALAATPGPWRWEVSLSAKQVELCGGPPKSGFGKYDHAVMSFRRWGMGGAAPVFWSWAGHMGTPRRADEVATPVEGREHHASWFRTIDDPNAAFIAAANPATLLALISQAEAREGEIARLREALSGFLWWGEQQCPCENEEPNPCTLCGASVENLENCKAVERKFPPDILRQARQALTRDGDVS